MQDVVFHRQLELWKVLTYPPGDRGKFSIRKGKNMPNRTGAFDTGTGPLPALLCKTSSLLSHHMYRDLPTKHPKRWPHVMLSSRQRVSWGGNERAYTFLGLHMACEDGASAYPLSSTTAQRSLMTEFGEEESTRGVFEEVLISFSCDNSNR